MATGGSDNTVKACPRLNEFSRPPAKNQLARRGSQPIIKVGRAPNGFLETPPKVWERSCRRSPPSTFPSMVFGRGKKKRR